MFARRDEVLVCAITIGELYAGFTSKEVTRWEHFVKAFEYCDISFEAARAAGQERHSFARRGQQVALADALIAAVACEQRAILVTDNLRHFPMSDVETLSPRE